MIEHSGHFDEKVIGRLSRSDIDLVLVQGSQLCVLIFADMDEVHLTANDGVEINAAKVIPTSIQYEVHFWSCGKWWGDPLAVFQHDQPSRMSKQLGSLNLSELDPSSTCHGFAFAQGQYRIDNNQVDKILSGDGYDEAAKSDCS